MKDATIVWADYMKYRLNSRKYDLSTVEQILRYSFERYVDTVTGRMVAIGQHGHLLVMIPYEVQEHTLTPVTIHAITRQQINYRIKTERFENE